MQQIKKTRANAGETLVEVVASIFIFLILMGILQGAISYSSNALRENKKIRSDNAKVIEALQNTGSTSVKSGEEIAFVATNANMTVAGSQVFATSTDLYKKVIQYQDDDGNDRQITFYLYQSADQTQNTESSQDAEQTQNTEASQDADQTPSDGGGTP